MRYTVDGTDVPEDCHCIEITALNALVDAFATRMKEKLRDKAERGRSGWDDENWKPEEIRRALLEHVGLSDEELEVAADIFDPVDVANFAAFYWNRREEATDAPS